MLTHVNKITHQNTWLSRRDAFPAFLQTGIIAQKKIKITVIGLEKMGAAIVERLLQSHYEVTIFDRMLSTIKPLVEKGAIPSDTLSAAVKNADVVLTVLLDEKILLEVVQEIIPYLSPHTIHVVLSRISPEKAQGIAYQYPYINAVMAIVSSVSKVMLPEEITIVDVGHKTDIEKVIPILKILVTSIVMYKDF